MRIIIYSILTCFILTSCSSKKDELVEAEISLKDSILVLELNRIKLQMQHADFRRYISDTLSNATGDIEYILNDPSYREKKDSAFDIELELTHIDISIRILKRKIDSIETELKRY